MSVLYGKVNYQNIYFHYFVNRRGSVIVDFFIFTSPDFSASIHDLQNALIGSVENSILGQYTVNISGMRGKLINK